MRWVRRILTLLLCSVLAGSTVAATPAPASAATATPYIKKLARKMNCKFGEAATLSAGDARATHGWTCVVGPGSSRRREYYLVTYRNTAEALDEWRDWTSCTTYGNEPFCEPGYIARKGKVLIIDQSSGDSYTYRAANYAARKVGGRVVAGYRYS